MFDARADLPRELLEADEALYALHVQISFSRYLNPINGEEARRDFLAGDEGPVFRYHPADWADDALRTLEGLRPPTDHPLGVLLQRSIERTMLWTLALRDRTAADFDALARHAGWYPDDALLAAARAEVHQSDRAPFLLDADQLIAALRDALDARGMGQWRVEKEPVMSARVLVDGAKELLQVNPAARFRERDVRKLVAHEVEVHALRAAYGMRQPLKLFSLGTPDSLITEEGLALVAEVRAGAASPGVGWRQGLVVQAVEKARHVGLRELYDWIASRSSAGLAWGISARLKRGLAHPEAPGVYAKDVVYYMGYRRVSAWLEAGNSPDLLYVGKVSVDDPVQAWIDAGLLQPQRAPGLFERR